MKFFLNEDLNDNRLILCEDFRLILCEDDTGIANANNTEKLDTTELTTIENNCLTLWCSTILFLLF